tara:strand:- start:5382 stop:5639 length:258 start_codon:yes stop_codon:yes gene_type:complete
MKEIVFLIFVFCFNLKSYSQHPYFHTSKDDIEKVAKKDGYRVTTEFKKINETMNLIFHLYKDSTVIRIGYVLEMDLPAYIHYREE